MGHPFFLFLAKSDRNSRRHQYWVVVLSIVCLFLSAVSGFSAEDSPNTSEESADEKTNLSQENDTQSSTARNSEEKVIQAQHTQSSDDRQSYVTQIPTVTRRGSTPRIPNGYGINGRMGHLAFPAFGRNNSITHVELFPYRLMDRELIFANLRGFVNNKGQFGGNLGIGYRQYLRNWNRVVGASLWYDADDSSSRLFQQVGFSLETYGEHWDARANFYLPVGSQNQTIQNRLSNLHYDGNQLLFDQWRNNLYSYKGVDLELGVLLPFDFAEEHQVRIFGGGYFFSGDAPDDIVGYKVRLEGNVTETIAAQVSFTDDDTFGTNVMVGINIELTGPSLRKARRTRRANLLRWVERNYNVILKQHASMLTDQAAINPATGQPWQIQHVSSNGAGLPDGSFQNPFTTIAAAQTVPHDLILVHADSVLTENVVLQEGDIIYGEGSEAPIPIAGQGTFDLPDATAGTNRAILQNVMGDALTLASNTLFSGIDIENATGQGMTGSSVNNALVWDVSVTGSGGDAIHLEQSSGTLQFTNVDVNTNAGDGFHIAGGDANILFQGNITNNTGHLLEVDQTTGGEIDLSSAVVSSNGGEGIRLNSMHSDVKLSNVTLENINGKGIEQIGGSGDVSFDGITTVTNSTSTGVHIANSIGHTWFNNLQVNNDGQTDLFVRNSAKLGIDTGNLKTTNGATAVDIEGTEIDIDLESVSAEGGPFGIRLVDTPGRFLVWGTDTFGTGGLISNTQQGIFLQNAGIVGLQQMDFDGNDVAIRAENSQRVVVSRVRVINSSAQAIDLLNVKEFELKNSGFDNNSLETIRMRFDQQETYSYNLFNNAIQDKTTNAIDLVSLSGSEGSTMSLLIEGNAIATTANDVKSIYVDWNGDLDARFLGNEISGSGDNHEIISVVGQSLTDLNRVLIDQNTFTLNGAQSKGVVLNMKGPADLAAETNTISMYGPSGIGLDFTMLKPGEVSLFSNEISDYHSGGTAVLFRDIAGTSKVAINSNQLRLLGAAGFIDEGIIFSNVAGDPIQLIGTENNIITNASRPFVAPIGSTTGSIWVNGSQVP